MALKVKVVLASMKTKMNLVVPQKTTMRTTVVATGTAVVIERCKTCTGWWEEWIDWLGVRLARPLISP